MNRALEQQYQVLSRIRIMGYTLSYFIIQPFENLPNNIGLIIRNNCMPVSSEDVSPFDWLHSDLSCDINISLLNDVTEVRKRAWRDANSSNKIEYHVICLLISSLSGLTRTRRMGRISLAILMRFLIAFSKGQSSRSPRIGPVNKCFETPAVNKYFLNAVSVFCQNLYLSSRFNPQILFGRMLITGGVDYNFEFSNCIINKGV